VTWFPPETPASVLIRRFAARGRIMHALVYLAYRYLAKYPGRGGRCLTLSEWGFVHVWAEVLHSRGKRVHGRPWTKARQRRFADVVAWAERQAE
jgi:hypothetical protein